MLQNRTHYVLATLLVVSIDNFRFSESIYSDSRQFSPFGDTKCWFKDFPLYAKFGGVTMTDPKFITFIVALVITTVVLLRGLGMISRLLSSDGSSGKSLATEMLSEKKLMKSSPVPRSEEARGVNDKEIASFSRTSGAIGTMGLAAVLVGVGYWLIYGLFYEAQLGVLKDAGWFFLSGSALFAPYAFNQLSGVFRAGA